MGVRSGRLHVADLAFQVYNRPLHPDWFAVRAHRRIIQPGWEADLRIIDGGHAIHFITGIVRMTEVLAGPETLLPEPGLLYHSAVRHERSTSLRPGPRVEYQSCLETERLDSQVFAHICDELILDPTPGDLFHRFPRPDRLSPAPLSRLHIEPRARSLTIHAFHTFPDERAIVRIQSLFEIRPS